MAQYLNIIRQFNTKELTDLLEKNGYREYGEVFKRQNITGAQFLDLSEFEISRWKLPIVLKNKLWMCLTNLKKDPQSFLNKTTTGKPQITINKPRNLQRIQLQTQLENVFKNQTENRQTPKPRLPSPPLRPPPSYLTMEKSYQNQEEITSYDESGYLLPTGQLQADNQRNHVPIAERSPMVLPRNPPEHDYIDDSEIGGGVEETYEPAPGSPPNSSSIIPGTKLDVSTLNRLKNLLSRRNSVKKNEPRSVNIYVNQAMKSETPLFKRDDLDRIPLNDIRLRPLPALPTDDIKENEEIQEIYQNEPRVEKQTLPLPSEKLPLPPVKLPEIPVITETRSETNSISDVDDLEDYDQCVFNLNDEPFYRNTDRTGAKLLLADLDNGAFLFRPSKNHFLTLTIKYETKFFNLGIERTKDNRIRCKSDDNSGSTPPEFATLNDFIKYFSRNPLTFKHKANVVEVYLKKALRSDIF